MFLLASFLFILSLADPPSDIPIRPPTPPVDFPTIIIPAERAVENPASFIFVDVRRPEDYMARRIPGALRMDPGLAVDADSKLERSEEILLYGDESSHSTIARTFFYLESLGFHNIRILDGGLSAWQTAGGAVSTEHLASPGSTGEVVPETAHRDRIDEHWVLRNLNQPKVELLDVRFDDEPFDESWPEGFEEGHIPLALPFDVSHLTSDSAFWPDPRSARKILAQLGPRDREHVDLTATFVLYGQDHQSLKPYLGYLLLRLMGLEVRVFAGGWQAWIEDPNRPRVQIVAAAQVSDLRSEEKDALVIDVRDEGDYRVGHIPSSINLPAYRFREDFAAMLEQRPFSSDTRIVFYCYGVDCTRSRNCSATAAELGFTHLYWFREGLEGWKTAGKPIDRDPMPPSTTRVFDDTRVEHPD